MRTCRDALDSNFQVHPCTSSSVALIAAPFVDDVDRRHYYDLLFGAARSYGIAVHAYVFMGNHLHLLLTSSQPGALSLAMRNESKTGSKQNGVRFTSDHAVSEPDPVSPPPPAGSPPAGDLFLTREHPAHGHGPWWQRQRRWATPVNLGGYADGGPNTKGSEYSPSVVTTREGTFLYFSSDGYPDSKSHDIYMSRLRADGRFGPGVRVAELSSDAADLMPNVRRDGLEIVFSSNCGSADPRNQDIWYATRPTTHSPWTVRGPIDNPAVNTTDGAETRATLSADGTRLYFGRKHFAEVPADPGDVYVSRRVKLHWGGGH